MSQPNFNPFTIIESDAEAGKTRVESLEDLRAAQPPKRKVTERDKIDEDDLIEFRPVRRPPMALLCLLDDGRDDGQWFRLRQDVTVMGRTEGDIIVPHDNEMSGRHLAIERTLYKDRMRWYLNDLESRNGSFVRVSKTILRAGHEMLIGGKRLRFDVPSAAAPAGPAAQETRSWEQVKATDLAPSLVEITPRGEGQRTILRAEDNWIGRDPSCSIALTDDLLANHRHARIYPDEKGTWHLENAGSRNGTWLRFKRLPIDGLCYFQVGEQRCILKLTS